MASIEFLQRRISGKQTEIEALQKKLGRIMKAKESNWEKNPYYYSERDLKYVELDIEEAQEALDRYQSQLASENEKAASRNIPVIIEFLDQWKERVESYYLDQSFPEYVEELKEYYRLDHEYTDWYNSSGFRTRRNNPEEYKRKTDEHGKIRDEFRSKWNFITPYVERNGSNPDGSGRYEFNTDKLRKELDQEANAKYDFIVDRTNAIVGTITDASDLRIGAKGDLNGLIYGTKGTAKVKTVGAGGYNIQCFHFRTLITPVRL